MSTEGFDASDLDVSEISLTEPHEEEFEKYNLLPVDKIVGGEGKAFWYRGNSPLAKPGDEEGEIEIIYRTHNMADEEVEEDYDAEISSGQPYLQYVSVDQTTFTEIVEDERINLVQARSRDEHFYDRDEDVDIEDDPIVGDLRVFKWLDGGRDKVSAHVAVYFEPEYDAEDLGLEQYVDEDPRIFDYKMVSGEMTAEEIIELAEYEGVAEISRTR